MKNAKLLLIINFFISIYLLGQTNTRTNYFPIWTFHQDSSNIHGISLGLWSFYGKSQPRFTNTNGIKVELIGAAFGILLIPRSSIVTSDSAFLELQNLPISENINGFNLSLGSICHCITNGVSTSFFGQDNFQVNGVSASLVFNLIQKQNGMMIAFWHNDSYKMNGIQFAVIYNKSIEMKGIQIGLFNRSENFMGIQLGLWNINQKRSLPILNWSF